MCNDNYNKNIFFKKKCYCIIDRKHDIIELHGFDGPEDDDTQKTQSVSASPQARNSTPSKSGPTKSTNTDEHFNFEDFLKLDLPPSVNCSRDVGGSSGAGSSSGESRFTQWFGRDKPSYSNGKFTDGNTFETKSTQQFFDYHQKANHKKTDAPNKLRSVDELEADWYPSTQAKPTEQKNNQQTNVNAIRMMLNQLATTTVSQKQNAMNPAQTNFLLNLINKSAETLYQHRLSQNATMKRPDAQLLLHRLVNGEITQVCVQFYSKYIKWK